MRASQAPEQWQLVLDAINKDDYELANKLAFKYNFAIKVNQEKTYNDIRHEPLKAIMLRRVQTVSYIATNLQLDYLLTWACLTAMWRVRLVGLKQVVEYLDQDE